MDSGTIISRLKLAADPLRKKASLTMFPTSMEYLGVRAPDLRVLLNEWWKELKNLEPEKLIGFAKELVATRVFECNQVAFELIERNKQALGRLSFSDLEELGKNMDNWGTTDSFSVMLAGRAWRNGQISDSDVLSWLDSGNRWWRRAAVVSTVGLNLRARGGTGDTYRTLLVCEKVVGDYDDMMVKALSWALRELSKSDKSAVEGFMKKYESRLAGRVLREVTHKLVTGKKN